MIALSQQQRIMVSLAAEGLVDKEIAKRMNLSKWTVQNYWHAVFAKYGTRTRSGVVATAMRRGEIV